VSKPASILVSGEDYPRDWHQFLDWFAGEEACLSYLEQLRWPEGFVCPRCGKASEPYRSSRGRLMCGGCRYQCTVTAGTVFDKTRTPLRIWFAAAWYLTNQKFGVSALGLQRVLGLGSYQTSWAMLHRFRRAMVRAGRERLRGKVEVDETYVGIRDPSKLHKGVKRKSHTFKTLVAIAIEVQEPKGFGRIRLRRIPVGAESYLLPFVRDAVEAGARVHTDGSPAYRSLAEHGYVHRQRVHLGSKDPAHVSMPGVHRVASLLKRWLLGTHQGAVQPSQLDYYLDEFTFRFNRRTSRSRGLLFYRLLEQAVATQPVTYQRIAARKA
jgi:transposase-like protein